MRAKFLASGLSSAVLSFVSLGSLTGCSLLQTYLSPDPPSVPNADAVSRALRLCALTHGDTPFHLKMRISPPARSSGGVAPGVDAMQAEVELWWQNKQTYRTQIHSAAFSQTRIVNGTIVQEQNIGLFYPRWIANFVDALFDPVPHSLQLRNEPGSIPVSAESHACISHQGDETRSAQICFQGKEPLLASGITFNRYVAFDHFESFGTQMVPRTLINALPANTLLRGEINLLEPLAESDASLLKATASTPVTQQIRTQFLSRNDAEAMLLPATAAASETLAPAEPVAALASGLKKLASYSEDPQKTAGTANRNPAQNGEKEPVIVYIRTDLTGRVREAYTASNDIYNQHQDAVSRAMQMRFRPLMTDGSLTQIEAPIQIQ